MTKQLKRSINKIIKNIDDDVEITPEAEELILEAVIEYVEKIAVEAKDYAYFLNRKTLRADDVDYAVRRVERSRYPLFIYSKENKFFP